MPNIVLVGFTVQRGEQLQAGITAFLEANENSVLKKSLKDMVFTVCSWQRGARVFEALGNDKQAPYVIVRDTELDQMRRLGSHINRVFNVDVELQKLDGFFSKHKEDE